jgi:hypothetical protein
MKRSVEALAQIGKARPDIPPPAKVENVIAVLAGAVEGALALQHLRVFRILMSAIRTNQENARSGVSLPDIGDIPHGDSPRNGFS